MKTTCKRGVLVTLLLLLFTCLGHAQKPPVAFAGPLYFSFPLLSQYPPLNTGMPFDALIGYIGGDSIARHVDQNQLRNVAASLTYSDTARYGAKYLYEMADNDPVTFFQWCTTQPVAGMYPSGGPGFIKGQFMDRMRDIAPAPLNMLPLLWADYIVHVKVTATATSTDTTAALARTAVLVTAYVLDTIKGRRVPFCINEQFSIKDKGNNSSLLQNTYGACLNWDYRLEWRRLNHTDQYTYDDSTLVDDQGNQWIQPNREYIVFLRYISLRRDDEYNYADLIPVTGWGTCAGMYPIKNGKVYDPYNDLGYGANLTVEQFKTALRNNIHTITHP